VGVAIVAEAHPSFLVRPEGTKPQLLVTQGCRQKLGQGPLQSPTQVLGVHPVVFSIHLANLLADGGELCLPFFSMQNVIPIRPELKRKRPQFPDRLTEPTLA
jgi:hypothetical protein